MNMLLPKRPKPIDHETHRNQVRRLPCCCTGRWDGIQAHHLVRDPNGEHCAARRSGDPWAVPLYWEAHAKLHDGPLDEPAFFAQYGVDQIAVARKLWALTERGLKGEAWLEEGRRIIEE